MNAFDDLTGDIESQTGSIGAVAVGDIFNNTIKAAIDIGSVVAQTRSNITNGVIQISSELTATSGSIGSVLAYCSLTAPITAGTSIGSVDAGLWFNGNLAGSLTAGTWIGPVTDDHGSITATLLAGTSIANVTARDNITATNLTIADVLARHGFISGNIKAKKNVGNVTAGTDITGDIESTDESIGDITAGAYDPTISPGSVLYSLVSGIGFGWHGNGSITGDMSAGANIGKVSAHAEVTGDLPATDNTAFSALSNQLAAWIAAGSFATSLPVIPRLAASVTSSSGDITG